eukprot:CAMPEP_0185036522 /NCGR_PEP_ID=MMETSP1103-20130426/29630_1 /TAXON_ID=36769 /ORGANISM="Paraphysomonas bandaiensis, Strain Caron Lab Isolate" /LENGTH=516 /DNA_ID=CAMNT_0027574085 /DNA_START=159 /DNA_END=1709 /DNA_ORIENTATION=+
MAIDDTAYLSDGTVIRGKIYDDIVMFKGIPYAQPPIGDLRWSPPKPWINSDPTTVVDATKYGSACVQGFTSMHGSEDCLFLNIYIPTTAGNNTSLPVGLFFHGGSYRTGTGNMYRGSDMVKFFNGQGIIVTINYRLNVFGFIGSAELRSQDSESGSTGVYGLQDQRLAMQWVKSNIEAFGGDGNNVMIFGESAGAGSISCHLAMQRSWGLFSSAVLESGSFTHWAANNMSNAEATYNNLLSAAGCGSLSCLLDMPTEDIFTASLKVHSPDPSVYDSPYYPAVDGVEMMSHPYIALSVGAVADVTIMHGTNSDEGSMFCIELPKDMDHQQLEAYWTAQGYSEYQINTLNELYVDGKSYPDGASKYWYAAERSTGDDVMSCPANYASRQLSSLRDHTSPVYLYFFDHRRTNMNYVAHFSEVPFVFHWEYIMRNEEDQRMADVMTSYWGNFIVDPNHDPSSGVVGVKDVPNWPAYGQSDFSQTLINADDIELVSDLKKEECDFFLPLMDEEIRMNFPAL